MSIWDFEDETLAYNAYFHHIYQNHCDAAYTGNDPLLGLTRLQVSEVVDQLNRGGMSQEEVIQTIVATPNSPLSRLQAEHVVKLAAGILIPLNFAGARGV
jgi:hypothetical protein